MTSIGFLLADEDVAKETVSRLLELAKQKERPDGAEDILGISICESSVLVDACTEGNNFEITFFGDSARP